MVSGADPCGPLIDTMSDAAVRNGQSRSVRKARREELSTFLKSRRARIRPEEVGLPVGTRRRTPGLRREEVAQLAGVGITWYTWLEQGRDINCSVQVLDAIARALALDGAEHAHLYRLADVPTIPSPVVEEPVPEEVQIILDHMHPLPAALFSAKYDVIANNAAYTVMYPMFMSGSRNVLRKVFLADECCTPYPSHSEPEHLARMVGYLRAAYARNIGDPEWVAFIDEMVALSPRFAELWARNDVAVPLGRTRVIRNLAVGELVMYMTSMSMPSIAGAWMQVWTPADPDAWDKLHALLAMTDDQRRRPWADHVEQAHGRALETWVPANIHACGTRRSDADTTGADRISELSPAP
ncbi:helix-turn-helix transcriptional regulator [Nocardia sp. CDC153]|uniref:helix-turn-helix transcriptional regulator n=1 Tax=Nocardia sp. CDC153 TaxID=3112167 RepID=UPI002DBC32B8|nr:helix-turn-helix transcriptional regulator [Nocardia sp. CDC153]MEC3957071.1 helix-turn-helix transcriptional regulator [Nocardia sp. CDC153]